MRRRIHSLLLMLWLAAALPGTLAAATTQGQAFDPELRKALVSAVQGASSFDDRFDAEVWLTDMASRAKPKVDDPDERLQILRLAHQEATRAELPPELVLALIEVESNFDRFAISHAGARGLMQVMPFWLDEIGRPGDNLFDIQTNLRFGTTILRFYLDKERGDWTRALARYNGSLGKTWYPVRVFTALRKRWQPL